MSQFTKDRALKARAIQRKGHDIQVIKAKFGFKSAADARHLIALGYHWLGVTNSTLTASELLLIRCLYAEHLDQLERCASVCSPKGKWVSGRARKSSGWAASVAAKRLTPQGGLGLVDASRNGYMNLTPAGWALAIELARQVPA